MLDWTGERFVPWAKEAAVAYEHIHRYLWAGNFVQDKRVLDLASGEGYGAEILARHASFVCGVDIDDEAIRHAAMRYRRQNLQFLRGVLTQVPVSEDHSFDVITCFEALEHIEQHDDMMREVKRLLKPGGLFIVSIPNKETYNAPGSEPNPFHVRELALAEFDALLTRYFSAVTYLGQHVHSVSSIWPLRGISENLIQAFHVERHDGEFRTVPGDNRTALYFVAIASECGDTASRGSVLLDCSDEFIRTKDEALAWRASQVDDLTKFTDFLQDEIRSIQTHVQLQNDELEKIYNSRGWKLVHQLRAIRDRILRKKL